MRCTEKNYISRLKKGKETKLKPTVDEEHPEKGEIIFDDIVIDLEK